MGTLLFITCATFAAQPKPSNSELGALKEEVERLRTEIEAMRNDLRQISQRLAGGGPPPAPRRATVTTGGGAAMGRDNAPLTLVEFSDYQCPFCRRFHEQTLSRLKTQYIDTGKVRYVFRDFPLDSIHPQARKASEAAHCAADQDKYWEAHDVFFENQQQLQPENLKSYAAKLGLKTEAFNDCLDKEKYKRRVQENQNDGEKAGVRGTPAFFLGKSSKDGSVDGVLISGAQPFENFQQEIERLLAENRAQ
jgi:protein-disulfide isomerase